MREIGTSWKITKKFRDFLDNIRSTRRSKVVGVDEKMLTQTATCELLVDFFKVNNEAFLQLIKFKTNYDDRRN